MYVLSSTPTLDPTAAPAPAKGVHPTATLLNEREANNMMNSRQVLQRPGYVRVHFSPGRPDPVLRRER